MLKWMKFALALLFACAAACGGGTNPEGQKATPPPGAAKAPAQSNPEKAPAEPTVQNGSDQIDAVTAAVQSADAWLKLLDEGKYGESWDGAAGLFKNAVTKDQWAASVKPLREPLGKVVSREIASKNYMTKLPGAPEGQYVVIQYTTTFENNKSAVETVTPMLDNDGQWRVSGYFVK